MKTYANQNFIEGDIQISPQGDKMALMYSHPISQRIAVPTYRFEHMDLTNYNTVSGGSSQSVGPHGSTCSIDFSKNGNYLYYSIEADHPAIPDYVKRYDISTGTTITLPAPMWFSDGGGAVRRRSTDMQVLRKKEIVLVTNAEATPVPQVITGFPASMPVHFTTGLPCQTHKIYPITAKEYVRTVSFPKTGTKLIRQKRINLKTQKKEV